MEIYPIAMVPGPVRVPEALRAVYRTDYGSADLEDEFLDLYNRCEACLQTIMATRSRVVIQSGEGMLALWAALKSCLAPGDRVLSVVTGVFGDGIGDMAGRCGAIVKKISLPFNETLSDLAAVENAIGAFKPKMITAVHCETPSGTLNPIDALGRLKEAADGPLLYVDAVSSIGGAPVLADRWGIDLCLGGSQKCLSSLPDIAFLSVSDRAWEVIDRVDYAGYDALKPFMTAQKNHYFPCTPNWHGIAALNRGAEMILAEGLERCFDRHVRVAEKCRNGLAAAGIEMFPAPGAVPSPTVSAALVPEKMTWPEFDRRLRENGLVVGGSYGPMAGKVFRLGHMGSQAEDDLVEAALAVIDRVVSRR
jgi:aspartate aminotransferase-like enzyme